MLTLSDIWRLHVASGDDAADNDKTTQSVTQQQDSNATLISLIDAPIVDENSNQQDIFQLHHHQQQADQKQKGTNIWEMVGSMDIGVNEAAELVADRSRSNTYEFRVNLDDDGSRGYRLDWTFDYPSNEISFKVTINLTTSAQLNEAGYSPGRDVFAFGFSDRGGLESADFCLSWYDLAHKLRLQDARVDSSGQLELISEKSSICRLLPSPDHDQLSIEEIERSGKMVIQFTRPLDPCDHPKGAYYAIDNGTSHLVWFTIRGPLLSLDGLDLGLLAERATKSRSANNFNNETKRRGQTSSQIGQFEWGLRRVQLVAARRQLWSGPELRREPDTSHHRHRSHHRHHDHQLNNDNYYYHHDIHLEAFHVPAKETTYWCKLFKLPEHLLQRPHHITKYAPLITLGNKHVVHHMELFHCVNLSPPEKAQLNSLYSESGGAGWSGECDSRDRPPASQACRRVIMAWAMGAKAFEYPPEAGQLVGGPGFSGHVMLEVHYNNVFKHSNLVDFSGLRFEYTNQLRQFDAGIMEIGLEYTPKNSIPPGLVAPLAGYCIGECNRQPLAQTRGLFNQSERRNSAPLNGQRPRRDSHQQLEGSDPRPNDDATNTPTPERDGGIFVFAGQMHTHLTGIGSWTEQIRAGHLIGELQRDDHYSPHFQEIRLLPEPRYVAPGDSLIHYCLYDTRARINITLGGFSTQEEMCVTYLHYYPRTELEVCKSSIDTRALEHYFAYLAREEAQETTGELSQLDSGSKLRPPPPTTTTTQPIGTKTNITNININTNNDIEPPSQLGLQPQWRQTHRHQSLISASQWKENSVGQTTTSNNMIKKSIGENYNSIEWSRRRSVELLQFYAQAPIAMQCDRPNGMRFAGSWNGMQATRRTLDELTASSGSGPNLWAAAPQCANSANSGPLRYRGSGFQLRHPTCALRGGQAPGPGGTQPQTTPVSSSTRSRV